MNDLNRTATSNNSGWRTLAGWLKQAGRRAFELLMRPAKGGLLDPGVQWSSCLRAVVLTSVTYLIFNTIFAASVDRAYYAAAFPELEDAVNREQRLSRIFSTTGADPSLKDTYIKEVFSEARSCREYLFAVIEGMQSEVPEEFKPLLDDYMTGQRQGWPWFIVSASPVSGKAIVRAIDREFEEWNRKNQASESAGANASNEAVLFLEKLIDRAAVESRGPLRRMMRLNGFVQWATICLCWLILVVCAERFLRVRRAVHPEAKLPAWLSRMEASAEPGDVEVASRPDGHGLSEELLDRRVYQTYEFMIALLPTLGFIGTVMGMGDALLSADGLFSAQDKGNALGVITQHLGFAFDTTLVGLVTGMLAGAAALLLRQWETRVWEDAGRSQESANSSMAHQQQAEA